MSKPRERRFFTDDARKVFHHAFDEWAAQKRFDGDLLFDIFERKALEFTIKSRREAEGKGPDMTA